MTDSNPELTLSDVTWLTSLARTLTRDGSLADDLVQETWLRVRRSPPVSGGINRPWLGRILRNVHLQRLRSDSRRAARERRASRDEALTDTAELVERAELHRTLADCLLRLDEPYRSTLMHVSFEGRTTAEIARSEDVSVDVVRRRLRRARELFKDTLERESGRDWKHWYAALAPFAELPLPHEIGAPVDVTTGSSSTVPSSAKLTGLFASPALLVATALVVAVGAGVWALSDDGLGADRDVQVRDVVPRTSEVAMADPAREPERREAAAVIIETSLPVAVTRSDVAEPAATYVLRGTLVVRDERDVEHSATTGHFVLSTSKGTKRVAVNGGLWELEVAADQSVNFRVYHDVEMTTDGRIGELTGGYGAFDRDCLLARDTDLNLTARWMANSEIAVLDAETREPLSGLTVVEGSMLLNRFVHPGPIDDEDVIHRDASSPLVITPRQRYSNAYFIRCDGYVWSRVSVDHMEGGRREVLLEPDAGDLTVRFRGASSGPVEVRMHVPGNDWNDLHFTTKGEDELVFDGLPVGTYALEARAGERAESVLRTVDVLAGPNEVVLDVPEPVESAPVRVTGTLVVPDGWDASDCTLALWEERRYALSTTAGYSYTPTRVAVSSMRPVEDAEGEWRFDAGEHPAGTYNVRLDGFAWRSRFEVGAEGTEGLRLEVAAPGEARLRLIDGRTGEVVTDQTYGIRFRLPNGVETRYDADTKRWRLRAPKGRVRGDALADDDKVFAFLDLELGDFPLESEVRLGTRGTLGFHFYENGERVPVESIWCLGIKLRVDGPTKDISFDVGRDEDETFFFRMPVSGTYTVTFPALEGYAPIPDVDVRVDDGVDVRHRVDLVR